MMKRISAILLTLTSVLGACAPNFDSRLVNLEGNQGKLMGAINILAACKADKDPKKPVTTVACPPEIGAPVPAAQGVAPAK